MAKSVNIKAAYITAIAMIIAALIKLSPYLISDSHDKKREHDFIPSQKRVSIMPQHDTLNALALPIEKTEQSANNTSKNKKNEKIKEEFRIILKVVRVDYTVKVFIDNNFVSEPPIDIPLPKGRHELKLNYSDELNRHFEFSKTVIIKSDTTFIFDNDNFSYIQGKD